MSTTTETKPRKAATPKALKKMTLGEAIERWAETTRAIEGLQLVRKQAEEILLEHAQRTGRRSFKDLIAVVQTGGSYVLDQPRVKEFLGERVSEFMKKTKLGLSLKLLR